jgi:hypothetical protein
MKKDEGFSELNLSDCLNNQPKVEGRGTTFAPL